MRPRKLKHDVGTLRRRLARHATPTAGHLNPSQKKINKNALTHPLPSHPPPNHLLPKNPTPNCLPNSHNIPAAIYSPAHSSLPFPTPPTHTTTSRSVCPFSSVFCVKQPYCSFRCTRECYQLASFCSTVPDTSCYPPVA